MTRQSRSRRQIAPPVAKALREAVAGKTPWPLFFFGPAGTGKTCGALCLVDVVLFAEFFDFGAYVQKFLDIKLGRLTSEFIHGEVTAEGWREAGFERRWDVGRWWTFVRGRSLLVLDDVGLRDRANDSQYEALKTTLDVRQGLPLIITSNLDIEGVGRIFDDRVADRIRGGTIIKVEGESRR